MRRRQQDLSGNPFFAEKSLLSNQAGERGQILLPSILLLPSLMLFLFLIMETAKLSREKIRHQFAVDAASFIEMTNYSDFLNRSAYVNGAFPQRIFAEGFQTTMIDRKNGQNAVSLFDILYHDGDFPSIGPASSSPSTNPTEAVSPWRIDFDSTGCGANKNSNPPDMNEPAGPGMACAGGGLGTGNTGGGPGGAGIWHIISEQDAVDYWLSWDDANDIYNLYYQIYSLLGSVEDAQFSVWSRLSGTTHTFFRRSYWLNTSDTPANSDPQEGAGYFTLRSFNPKAYCIENIMFYGNKPTSDPFQPYKINAPQTPIPMPQTMSTSPNACSRGLFHLETVPDSDLADMTQSHDSTGYPGYNVIQHYTTGVTSNYFNINFANIMNDSICGTGPCVHATIDLSGGHVWPDPTPKFQTRLYP